MARLEVDLNFSIHTSYHNDFFLLRTKVLVNGENTEIRSKNDNYVGRFQGFWSMRVFRTIFEGFEGTYEGPVLSFCHSGRTISAELWLFAEIVSRILQQYGVYHVDALYYERSPLFRVVFTSESCLKEFILAIGEVKSALEPKLQLFFARHLNSVESARRLTVGVHPELFLVSPDRHRGFENYLVHHHQCILQREERSLKKNHWACDFKIDKRKLKFRNHYRSYIVCLADLN